MECTLAKKDARDGFIDSQTQPTRQLYNQSVEEQQHAATPHLVQWASGGKSDCVGHCL